MNYGHWWTALPLFKPVLFKGSINVFTPTINSFGTSKNSYVSVSGYSYQLEINSIPALSKNLKPEIVLFLYS